MSPAAIGVSFVVPVLNGRRTLRAALDAILAQRDGRPFEVIVVDDGSTDGTGRWLRRLDRDGVIRLLAGPARGPAAAVNAGIREAAHPIVCQIDQDVILHPGWLAVVLRGLADQGAAAAQGHYVAPPQAGLLARVMGLDLEQRYAGMQGPVVDHVCTGNVAYRASALHDAGLLDERLGYGCDNDLSYRLAGRGHRLVYCSAARATHYWREGWRDYLRQQFGVGYGRLDVVARHPRRAGGDDVSGTLMMLHAPMMLGVWLLIASAAVAGLAGWPWHVPAALAAAVAALLFAERAAAGLRAWRTSGERAGLAFPCVHLARDAAWAAAIVVWLLRRVTGRSSAPAHSLLRRGRLRNHDDARDARSGVRPGSLLVVVPAFNEAANLARVAADLRRAVPAADILIVDDGSDDGTAELLPRLGVAWLTLSERIGVGGAVRTGIRYAARAGYQYVVRVDGDGQHRACDIGRLLLPVLAGQADAVIGSRFLTRRPRSSVRRTSQSALALMLGTLTGRRVTDPTSGFWLFGPRALTLLGRHHPGGYAEPELILFLHRNRLRVAEVSIRMRPRLSGRTSLTAARTAAAFARTALALIVVPIRRMVGSAPGD